MPLLKCAVSVGRAGDGRPVFRPFLVFPSFLRMGVVATENADMGMRARTGLRKVPPNATGRAEIERREGALRRLLGSRNFAKSPLPSRQWPPPSHFH